MTNLSFEFQSKKDLLDDVPMPRDLHSKIMKRVFIASYSKYLFAATIILFVNLIVVSIELYRRIKEVQVEEVVKALSQNLAFSPAYVGHAAQTLYAALPVQSIVATLVTAGLCTYMTLVIIRFNKNPRSMGFIGNLVR